MKSIVQVLFGIYLLGFTFSAQAQEACQIPLEDRKRPRETAPKMMRYQIQEIYLGMSFRELQLNKPAISVRPVTESGVIHEYFVEYFTKDEHFLFLFTFDGRLYKLVYRKKFDAAVSEEELKIKLIQRYGQPDNLIETLNTKKVFEACWGQCQMIRQGVFCQNEDTEHWYTYFTAGLSITRKEFFAVLHDSALYERNEIRFVERKKNQQTAPSTTALNNLKL